MLNSRIILRKLNQLTMMGKYSTSTETGAKQFSPSADRNKQPILEKLIQIHQGEQNYEKKVLEISSGTGQHIVHFARHFTQWTWQPSDYTEQYVASVRAYIADEQLNNVKQPILVDVTTDCSTWGEDGSLVGTLDLVVNMNMIHITPIECTHGLLRNAGILLKPGGRLVTYGPYAVDGVLEPESNVNFNARLQDENPFWGIRDVALLKNLCVEHGLVFKDMFDMPANNKCLCFVKGD